MILLEIVEKLKFYLADIDELFINRILGYFIRENSINK